MERKTFFEVTSAFLRDDVDCFPFYILPNIMLYRNCCYGVMRAGSDFFVVFWLSDMVCSEFIGGSLFKGDFLPRGGSNTGYNETKVSNTCFVDGDSLR